MGKAQGLLPSYKVRHFSYLSCPRKSQSYSFATYGHSASPVTSQPSITDHDIDSYFSCQKRLFMLVNQCPLSIQMKNTKQPMLYNLQRAKVCHNNTCSMSTIWSTLNHIAHLRLFHLLLCFIP